MQRSQSSKFTCWHYKNLLADILHSITPIETVVEAYDLCLMQPNLNGQLIECSGNKQFFLSPPEMANGAATKRACTVWEPLFEAKHQEKSGLPDAIL